MSWDRPSRQAWCWSWDPLVPDQFNQAKASCGQRRDINLIMRGPRCWLVDCPTCLKKLGSPWNRRPLALPGFVLNPFEVRR